MSKGFLLIKKKFFIFIRFNYFLFNLKGIFEGVKFSRLIVVLIGYLKIY